MAKELGTREGAVLNPLRLRSFRASPSPSRPTVTIRLQPSVAPPDQRLPQTRWNRPGGRACAANRFRRWRSALRPGLAAGRDRPVDWNETPWALAGLDIGYASQAIPPHRPDRNARGLDRRSGHPGRVRLDLRPHPHAADAAWQGAGLGP